MILLAESLAQELRETRISQDLTDAAARAHARDARFEPAFALMAILDGRDMVTQSDLRSDLAQKLAQRAPDDGFLLIAFQEGLMLPSADLSDVAAQALAERLLSLGFGVEADGLAAMIPGAAPDLQLLRGRIAFARGYPELALEHLTALESRAAATLRAEIRAAMGATGEAADLFGRIGASKQAASAAWASGDPTVIEQHGAPPQQAFIRSLTGGEGGVPLTETAQVATQDVTQANLRSLLEGTAAFRSAAEALLADQPNRNQ
jgi:hypothetical protein